MKKLAIALILLLSACGVPTTAEPTVEYKGRLTACQLSTGEQDTDYPALLVFTDDPHKVLFGVGAVHGTDTWMLVSEATLDTTDNGTLKINGTFDPVGDQTEAFHLTLHNGSYYDGDILLDSGEAWTETCNAYFKSSDE